MNTLVAVTDIVIMVLQWVIWLLVIWAILSWLIAFNVVNTQNNVVRSVSRSLDRFFDPILRPIRRILPDMGGIDLSPMVLIVIIILLQKLLRTVPQDLGLF